MFYLYPPSTLFDKLLPKQVAFSKTATTTAQKKLLSEAVEAICWKHKLASETLHLSETPQVLEIQVIHLHLKEKAYPRLVLEVLDKAIPHPVVFELYYGQAIKQVLAYKRPSLQGNAWIVESPYFESPWVAVEAVERHPLPVALNLECLYQAMLLDQIPFPIRSGEAFSECLLRQEEAQRLQGLIHKLEAQLHKEPQLNRKHALFQELRQAKQALETATQL
ncbi:MAG: DUF4391 domain-containing protein [Vampirovibrionales bacterium]